MDSQRRISVRQVFGNGSSKIDCPTDIDQNAKWPAPGFVEFRVNTSPKPKRVGLTNAVLSLALRASKGMNLTLSNEVAWAG